MSYRDLRDALAALEQKGLLRHVTREVDKNWELSAVMRWVYQGYREEQRYAIMFDKVKGYSIPVVVGAIGASYKSYALGLGIDPIGRPRSEVLAEVRRKWTNAMQHPILPRIVSTGPCKENILKGNDIDMHKFPVPVWTPEKDGNWDQGYGFITSAYHVTRDPETGIRNVGTYRSMIRKQPNEMGISTQPGSDLTAQFRKNEKMGKPTEVATVIGAEPCIGMTSVTTIPSNMDEVAVSGGLKGEPIDLVKCETVDLEVPATAEIVIEGRIRPDKDRPFEVEGPFGEYSGYQGQSRLRPVFEITCITHRNNPIYQAFISQMPPSESSKVRKMGWEALVLGQLEAMGIGGVVDINMVEGGGSVPVIISIKKQGPGHAARLANVIFSIQPRFSKMVIVVDDDIDVHDLENVMWAVTFRTSLAPGRRAIHFVDGLTAPDLDYSAAPSAEEALLRRKLGAVWPASGVVIDATRPYTPYAAVSLPPAKYLVKARDNWAQYGLPALDRSELPRCIAVEEEYIREGIVTKPV
jgi:UbiD family decarboxylase